MICSRKIYEPTSLTLADVEEALKVDRNKLRLDATGNLVERPAIKNGRPPQPLLNYVNISSKTECWTWQGGCTGSGYGTIRVYPRALSASRLIFLLLFGPLPPYMEVCHICNHPTCVNPYHLYSATHKQNMRDAFKDGLISRLGGVHQHLAKLTDSAVKEIRSSSRKTKELAAKFRVHKTTIENVRNFRTWRHVA